MTDLIEAAKSSGTALANLASFMAADAGAGLENIDSDCFAIPFLQILQGLSPQIESVVGAKPGLIINTITNELFKTCQVIQCAFTRRYLAWADRADGGGFRGEYLPSDVETGKIGVRRDAHGRLFDEQGFLLRDTRNHYLLVKSEKSGNWTPALLSLASSQVKKSKRWLSLIQNFEMTDANGRHFTPPSFAQIFELGTEKEENNLGSWYGLTVKAAGIVEDAALYSRAKKINESVLGGKIRAESESAEF